MQLSMARPAASSQGLRLKRTRHLDIRLGAGLFVRKDGEGVLRRAEVALQVLMVRQRSLPTRHAVATRSTLGLTICRTPCVCKAMYGRPSLGERHTAAFPDFVEWYRQTLGFICICSRQQRSGQDMDLIPGDPNGKCRHFTDAETNAFSHCELCRQHKPIKQSNCAECAQHPENAFVLAQATHGASEAWKGFTILQGRLHCGIHQVVGRVAGRGGARAAFTVLGPDDRLLPTLPRL